MKSILFVILAHAVGIVVLAWAGMALNGTIKTYADSYAGLIAVFTTAFGIYSFAVNMLYQRSRRFHFWVNRLRLLFSRTHTYWQPQFDLELPADRTAHPDALLDEIWQTLQEGAFGQPKMIEQATTKMAVSLDDVMCFVLRIQDSHLTVHLDRKLLVPSHLYEAYRHKLARLAEEIQRIAKPVSMRYGLTVSFGDGVSNPYYGFFVNRIPTQLLQHFEVVFRPDSRSSCRVEAGTDHVSIEGKSHVDLFEALSQVLALRALPDGIPE